MMCQNLRRIPHSRLPPQTSGEILVELPAVLRRGVLVIAPLAATDALDGAGVAALAHDGGGKCRGCVVVAVVRVCRGDRAPIGGHVDVWEDCGDGVRAAKTCLG